MGETTRIPRKIQNGIIKQTEGKHKDPEFMIRESPLTNLLKESASIRTIYHIFIVILLLLFAETVVYDLFETGT